MVLKNWLILWNVDLSDGLLALSLKNRTRNNNIKILLKKRHYGIHREGTLKDPYISIKKITSIILF